VDDRDAIAQTVTEHGGKVLSKSEVHALKFRAPDGIVAEIFSRGAFHRANTV
jgi:hypothetical protein